MAAAAAPALPVHCQSTMSYQARPATPARSPAQQRPRWPAPTAAAAAAAAAEPAAQAAGSASEAGAANPGAAPAAGGPRAGARLRCAARARPGGAPRGGRRAWQPAGARAALRWPLKWPRRRRTALARRTLRASRPCRRASAHRRVSRRSAASPAAARGACTGMGRCRERAQRAPEGQHAARACQEHLSARVTGLQAHPAREHCSALCTVAMLAWPSCGGSRRERCSPCCHTWACARPAHCLCCAAVAVGRRSAGGPGRPPGLPLWHAAQRRGRGRLPAAPAEPAAALGAARARGRRRDARLRWHAGAAGRPACWQ